MSLLLEKFDTPSCDITGEKALFKIFLAARDKRDRKIAAKQQQRDLEAALEKFADRITAGFAQSFKADLAQTTEARASSSNTNRPEA